MFKLTFCLRRLPNLTREEFQDYWLNKHGPLVRKHAKTALIKRYIQHHTMLDNTINDGMREVRGGPEGYDGVAELWWDSAEDLAAGYSTPEGRKVAEILLEDEKKFIDLSQSPLWFGEEHVVFEE